MKNTSTELVVVNHSNKIIKKRKKLSRFYLYCLYLLLFSFIGWIAETFYCLHKLGYFMKRGFLYGPLCPIYGWGALILIIFFSKYKNKNLKLFIYAAIIFSTFEYLVSYCMDALFAARWWDYTNEFLNLNGRISIFYSFVWGIAAILFINFILPFFKKKINIIISKIPYAVLLTTLRVLMFAFILDTLLSFIRYLI